MINEDEFRKPFDELRPSAFKPGETPFGAGIEYTGSQIDNPEPIQWADILCPTADVAINWDNGVGGTIPAAGDIPALSNVAFSTIVAAGGAGNGRGYTRSGSSGDHLVGTGGAFANFYCPDGNTKRIRLWFQDRNLNSNVSAPVIKWYSGTYASNTYMAGFDFTPTTLQIQNWAYFDFEVTAPVGAWAFHIWGIGSLDELIVSDPVSETAAQFINWTWDAGVAETIPALATFGQPATDTGVGLGLNASPEGWEWSTNGTQRTMTTTSIYADAEAVAGTTYQFDFRAFGSSGQFIVEWITGVYTGGSLAGFSPTVMAYLTASRVGYSVRVTAPATATAMRFRNQSGSGISVERMTVTRVAITDAMLAGTSLRAARCDHGHVHSLLSGLGADDHPQYVLKSQLPVFLPTDGEDGEDGQPGPPGQPGAAGAPGTPGGTGPAGSSTPIFLPGDDGDEGQPGPPGPPGAGAQGPQGVPGATGPQGVAAFFPGDDGDEGQPGPPGAAGAAGTAGTPGTTGSQGPMGPAVFLDADPGEEGQPGPPGPAGAAGTAGTPGNTGSQGPTGPAVFLEADMGEQGDVGPPGAQGPIGLTGAGTIGAQGPMGPAVFLEADYGEDGQPGPPGIQGVQGIQGIQGPPGSGGGGGSPTIWLPSRADEEESPPDTLHYPPGVPQRAQEVLFNQSSAGQALNSVDTYITGAMISVPPTKLRIGSVVKWVIGMTKSAAGVTAPVVNIRVGTNGSTADTAVVAWTLSAQTGVVDHAVWHIYLLCRGPLSASGIFAGSFTMNHNLATTGFSIGPQAVWTFNTVSAAFDVTTAGLKIGISMNPAALAVWTAILVDVETVNL